MLEAVPKSERAASYLYFIGGETASTDGRPFTVTKNLQTSFVLTWTFYQSHCNYTTWPATGLNALII